MFRSSFVLMIFVIIQVQDALGQFGTPLLVRSADVVLHDHHVHEDHDPHARLAALDHFLGTYVHHNHGLGILQQAREGPGGCTANDKFKACCVQIGMTSPVTNIQNLIDNGCKYPPDELNTMERITLGSYFNEYVMCYADGRNSMDCCAVAGVPAEKKYGVWKVNCQHLCNGHVQTLSANPGWKKCTVFKPQIAKCNEDGTEFDDTAAVRNGFCKHPVWCKSPMQWKGMCRPKVMAHTYLGR
uniref:Secreted protein n=1 Tax=Globodera rostochiensis TaxID=31243 RepID=A0A914HK46_GLORO